MSDDTAVESTTEQSGSEEERDHVAEVEKCRKSFDAFMADWKTEAEEAYAFVSGKQWNEQETAEFEEKKRLPIVFNRVAPIVNAIRGQEVANRTEATYIPRREGPAIADDVMTTAARYVRDLCDAEDDEADAFADAVICGIGCTDTRMDYLTRPEGDVIIERRDPLDVRWDHTAHKRNLTDRKWEQSDDWLTLDEIKARWPGADVDALKLDAPDLKGEPHDATNAWKYERNARGYDRQSDKYRVTRHIYIELETYYRVLDPATAQIIEVDEDQIDVLKERSARLGMPLQMVRATRQKFEQCFVVGKTLLEHSDAPSQKTFPLKFITGYRDRNENIWHGIVRYMRDPQKFANKVFSLMHHILASNAKGGLMVEAGAIANRRKFEDQWSAADSIVELNAGAIQNNKIKEKPQGEYPVQLDHMLQFSVTSIRDSVGVGLELLGMAEKNQPGVLESQRVRQSLVLLSVLFDSLRAYRKQQGRLLAEYIWRYLSDGRLVRMVGQQGAEYIKLVQRDPDMIEYDLFVDEASTARDVKERTFAVMMAMIPQLAAVGVPFPEEIIDYVPIPESLREKWKQKIAQSKQQGRPPSPEQIKMQGALQLQQVKHANKLQEIQANSQADAQREAMQAQSEQVIDTTRTSNKVRETIVQHNEQRSTASVEAALQERLVRLEAALDALLKQQEHQHTTTEARMRPAPLQ